MRSRPLGFVLAVCAFAACSRDPAPSAPAPALAPAAVVYGEDDRREWYAHPSAEVRERARATVAAMVAESDVVAREDGGWDLVYGESLGEANGLCADEPFRDQPTVPVCSGTLIDERLLLTAGHCVQSLADCAGYLWVFDYRYEAPGVFPTLGPDSVYRCVDLVTNGFYDRGDDYDFAIIELDRPVVGREPAAVMGERRLGDDDALQLIGFPNGIPMKIADNGAVIDKRDGDDWFVAAVDAFYGNSGSGVFGPRGDVAGVLVSGADDYRDVGSCAKVLTLDEEDGEEIVTYASAAVATLCDKHYPSVALCGESAKFSCGDGWCTDGETPATCGEDCDGLVAVPAEWSCNAAWYGVGDDCDCACGTYDPDCDDDRLRVLNCAPGSECLAGGDCQIPVPETWTCPREYYGSEDECDCGCGARDPDCDHGGRVVGCARGSACLADGACEIPIPAAWRCPDRWYAGDDDCDCDCGAYDPDCGDPSLNVVGCAGASACREDGTCEASVPESWICRRDYYAAGDECDCNCGAFDPDCQDPRNRILNCAPDQLCGALGDCRELNEVEPPPERGPEPVPEPMTETDPAGDAGAKDASAESTPANTTEARGGSRDEGCAGGQNDSSALAMGLAAFVIFARRLGVSLRLSERERGAAPL